MTDEDSPGTFCLLSARWPTQQEIDEAAGTPTAWLANDRTGPALFLDRGRAVTYAGKRRTDLEALYSERVIFQLLRSLLGLRALVEDLRTKP